MLRQFVYMLPVTVAYSSSDSNAIYYALLVLFMTSLLHMVE